MYSFYTLYKGIPYPIYLKDLSTYSQYRYLILCVFSFIGFSLIFLKKNDFSSFFLLDLKAEAYKILYFCDRFLGEYCLYIYKKIYESRSFAFIFFFIHFTLSYLFKILSVILLFRCIFFHGDFCLLLYLAIPSFVAWVYNFYFYYFKKFCESTRNYIKDLLIIECTKPISEQDQKNQYITCRPTDFIVNLSPIALAEGFSTNDLKFLFDKWLIICNIDLKFLRYDLFISWIRYGLFSCLFFCWTFLSFHFFVNDSLLTSSLNFWGVFKRTFFLTNHLPLRGRDARFVNEGISMNRVKVGTKGAVSPGHPVIGEEEGNSYRVDGAITHGKGSIENPSHPLSPTGISPDGRPVNFIPVGDGIPKKFPLASFSSPIPNSEPFCEDKEVKTKIDEILEKKKNLQNGD